MNEERNYTVEIIAGFIGGVIFYLFILPKILSLL